MVPGTEHWGKHLKDGEFLDGECYVHGMDFESITSAFKTAPEKLEFHVFDYYDVNRPNLVFEERMSHVTVETLRVEKKEDLQGVHDAFATRGYEGIMIRNPRSTYEPGRRSNSLLKMKMFETDEFRIMGCHEGTGRDVGTPIWECETKEGEVFSVRPEGSMESRREAFEYREDIVGKMLTVRYQNMTATGVPRFPVGIVVRDYE